MAINKRTIPASIGSFPLDTGTDPKIVSQGVTRLENASYRRKGAIGHVYGSNETHSTTFADGYCAAHKGRAMIWKNGEQRLWDGYDFVRLDSGFRTLDAEAVRMEGMGDPIVFQHSMAEFGNIRAVVWIGSDPYTGFAHHVATYEIDSGLLVEKVSMGYVYSLSIIEIVATSTSLVYFFVDTDGDLRNGLIDTATGAIGLPSKINAGVWPQVKAAVLSKDFDVCAFDGGDNIVVGWIGDGGTPDGYCVWGTMNSYGVADGYNWRDAEHVGTIGVFDAGDDDGHYGLSWVDSRSGDTDFYVFVILGLDGASLDSGDIELWNWTDTNVTILSPPMGVKKSSTEWWVYLNVLDDNYTYPEWGGYIRRNWFDADENTGSCLEFHEGALIAGRPWNDRSTPDRHQMVIVPHMATPGDQSQITFHIVGDFGLNLPRYMGRFMLGSAFGGWPARVIDTLRNGTQVYRSSFAALYPDDTMGLCMVDMTEPEGRHMTAVETLNHLVFPGSVPYVWDGQVLAEQGFLLWPYRLRTIQKSGAGLDAPSTYGYVATYEWYDSRGNRWQSAPSLVASHKTNTGYGQVYVRVPPLTMHDPYKQNINIILWRTDGYGIVYRRVDQLPNAQFAAYVEFTDNLSDSSLASREVLYTQPPGDVLEDICPPPTRIACVHQNRLFVVNREKDNIEIQYTKEFQYNHGIRHSDFLTVEVPSADGEITAMASFMDRLIVFKRNSIWYSYGNGLSNTGSGTGYTAPQLLHPSIGCVNQKTIAEIPAGLMFLGSNNKIHIINRSMQVSVVGEPVAYHTRTYPPVSAAAIPSNNEVVFASATVGHTCVYNWEYGLWSVWAEWSGSDCSIAKVLPAATAFESGGESVLWMVRHDGKVVHQKPGLFGHWVAGAYSSGPEAVLIETGWFPFAQVGGFQRLRRIVVVGQMPTLHKLGVRIAYDFEPAWADDIQLDVDGYMTKPFGYEQFIDGTNDNALLDKGYVVEITGSRQKCSAVRLQLYDISPDPGNSDFVVADCGFELTALAFEVGVKNGPFRPGDGRHTD
jgi:hypothetical protein